MRLRSWIVLILPLLLASAATAAVHRKPILKSLEWKNLTRSDPSFLSRVIHSRPGEIFSATRFAEDLKLLRSWELYRYVRGTTWMTDAGEVTATIELGERWTLTPVFRPNSGGGVYSLKLGARDTNFLGRFYEIALYGGARYSSDQMAPLVGGWLLFPYLRGSRWDLQLWGDWDFIEDPVYTVSDDPDFVSSKRGTLLQSGLGYRFADNFQLRNWLIFEDSHEKAREDFTGSTVADHYLTSKNRSVTFGPQILLGLPEYNEPLYSGEDLDASILCEAGGALPPSARLTAEARLYRVFWSRFNIASRVLLGWTSSHEWSRLRTLGGLTNLRGFPDRYFHSRGYGAASIELRATVFDTRLLSLQLKIFTDMATMLDRYSGTHLIPFDSAYTAGFGAYFWVPFMHKMRLRVDVARPLNRSMIRGVPDISSGIVQFF